MAKKHKTHAPSLSVADMRDRILHALSQERTHNALDLARSLFKQDRSPENLQLLQRATLARARQLRKQGQTRDAATLLQNALDMSQDANFLQQIAEELAQCGQAKQALELLARTGANGQQTKLTNLAVDAALREGPNGRKNLPDALHPHFNLIVQAFADLEAGRDEQVRSALQEISLTSPFLEWKLLLRGLQAYWNNDDVRALENWSRLDHNRVPARLAAPFRFQIDKEYRDAQPSPAQLAMREVAERLEGAQFGSQLRKIRALLAGQEQVTEALQLMNTILPVVKQQAPQLVPRLANIFYWAIIDKGMPDDTPRYKRVFGAPADDPELLKMQALALELRHMTADANEAWQDYSDGLGNNSGWTDPSLVKKARALIWRRMGDNASFSGPGQHLPDFIRGLLPKLAAESEQPPDIYYRKSLEYDPDYLDAHESLFRYLRDAKRTTDALAAGRDLIRRFPNHVETLEELSDVYMAERNFGEALALARQALQHNPLEQRLRVKTALAHFRRGRQLAAQGDIPEGRKDIETALEMQGELLKVAGPCLLAGCAYKAGERDRGDEILEQARQLGADPLELSFRMAAEAALLQVPTKLRTRFSKEFAANIAGDPTSAATEAIVSTLVAYSCTRTEYHGFKTHVKKILAYVERAVRLEFTEVNFERICEGLLILEDKRALRKYLALAQRKFPENPLFELVDAQLGLTSGRPNMWRIGEQARRIRRLIDNLPQSERKQKLLSALEGLEGLLKTHAMNSFPFQSIFASMVDEFAFDDDDDDEFF